MKKRYIVLLVFVFVLQAATAQHTFNGSYSGKYLDRIAFPIGGIGAGMFCLEGTGAISHFSIRHKPEMFKEPRMFGAITIVGHPESARVLEGPVPDWKKFGQPNAAIGDPGTIWGLARCQRAKFKARFPFAEITLNDPALPLSIKYTGWSPFIPTDADNSSLPVGALEYTFRNTGTQTLSYVFSYNSRQIMALPDAGLSPTHTLDKGFILSQEGGLDQKGEFAIFTDDPAVVVNYCWFRGNWFDPLTRTWDDIQHGVIRNNPPQPDGRGADLQVPFTLKPGEEKTIRVMMAWYVPDSKLRLGQDPMPTTDSSHYKPWYSSKFSNIGEVVGYWRGHYDELRHSSVLFRDAFYRSTLPAAVMEAVAANLTILKSPTVLRQYDGRLWAWEGCEDTVGSCPGSCTHVWNYAQALPHLFPSLERSLRATEFNEDQNAEGHQEFRASLPIRPLAHTFYAASDGQLGGILKVYRDWRISGDSAWLRQLYPKVKASLDYCIRTWDPRHVGALEEPHHNTYDIEFWGPEGFTTSFYLGALEAFVAISEFLREDASSYRELYTKGRHFMEQQLYNGQYFYQRTKWTGLNAGDPVEFSRKSFGGDYSPETLEIFKKEGPKYQLGTGCLSDGVLGAWMTRVCGLPEPVDTQKISSHLKAVYTYNFHKDLSTHSNPQRTTYALGHEGGLLLASWPRGGKLSLPFGYSGEVWTGIEYQVASHLIFHGQIKQGLDIVEACRKRYDGRVRNPFDEYECGHWYARAMSSYALIEALTGVRYDAVTKTLYVNSRVGNFVSFLSAETGFGNVIYHQGKARLEVAFGKIPVEKIIIGQK